MSLIDTAKDIYELAKKGVTIELQEQLMKFREEALALQEENLKLKGRVAELEAQRQTRENLSFDGTVYWCTQPDGQREGPYCQRCYDSDGKLVRLQNHHYSYQGRQNYSWQCRACSMSFEDKAH